MYLKSDFERAVVAAASAQPDAAALMRAGDPILLAQMSAQAAMLAMMSAQADVAEVEPFVKSRTGTVLADATLKGILPLGKPARVEITVTNPGAAPVAIASGRGLLDAKGMLYAVEGSATIPATGSGSITAVQITTRQFTHTVAASVPFYELQVEASEDAVYIAGIEVTDQVAAFAYSPDFCNVGPGDRVFHVETDEYRRLFLRFGASTSSAPVVGHQPANGDVLTITVRETGGPIALEAGSAFALAYVANADEAELGLALNEIIATGAAPPDTETLRMLARYPALHDGNAVFLSNFDFLLRRQLSGVQFLSVWNEQVEELARGPSLANINKLFVSFVILGQSNLASENQIRQIVGRADDSYGLVFVAPRLVPVPVTVTATVAVVHDTADVEAQIRTVLIQNYGRGSLNASRGLQKGFRQQRLNSELKAAVPALQDQISDFTLVLGDTGTSLPEDFRFFDNASIAVIVTRISDATGLWSL
jgi:hypothetical protein